MRRRQRLPACLSLLVCMPFFSRVPVALPAAAMACSRSSWPQLIAFLPAPPPPQPRSHGATAVASETAPRRPPARATRGTRHAVTPHAVPADPPRALRSAPPIHLSGPAQAGSVAGHVALGYQAFVHQPLRQAGIEAASDRVFQNA